MMMRDRKRASTGSMEQQRTRIVFGEGKSEKVYFDKVQRVYEIPIKTISCEGDGIERIKKKCEASLRNRKKKDLVAIVIDVDDHTLEQLLELEKWCNERDVMLLLSNPAWEVWLNMHFRDVNASMTLNDLNHQLNAEVGGIRYEKGTGIPVDEKNIEQAYRRADKSLPEKMATIRNVFSRPGTTNVHRLIAIFRRDSESKKKSGPK